MIRNFRLKEIIGGDKKTSILSWGGKKILFTDSDLIPESSGLKIGSETNKYDTINVFNVSTDVLKIGGKEIKEYMKETLSLTDLSDVNTSSSKTSNDSLVWDGTKFVVANPNIFTSIYQFGFWWGNPGNIPLQSCKFISGTVDELGTKNGYGYSDRMNLKAGYKYTFTFNSSMKGDGQPYNGYFDYTGNTRLNLVDVNNNILAGYASFSIVTGHIASISGTFSYIPTSDIAVYFKPLIIHGSQPFADTMSLNANMTVVKTKVTFLKELGDVNFSTISDKQLIRYNNTTKQFEPVTPSLSLFSELNITSPSDKQHLVYDAASGKWVNSTPEATSGGSVNLNSVVSAIPGYSTTETLTEKRWIDGKPIYRIVIDLKTTTVIPNYSLVDTCVNTDFIYERNDGYIQGDTVSDVQIQIYCQHQSNGSITFYTAGQTIKKAYYTVWYTKISDTSASPVASMTINSINGTSEAPAYSTSEVLTERRWVDDKPIYRKYISPINIDPGTWQTLLSIASTEILLLPTSRAFGIRGPGDTARSGNFSTDSSYFDLSQSNTAIVVFSNSNLSTSYVSKVGAIIEYTKVADTAFSPVAKPVAVPLSNNNSSLPGYSTNEILTTERWVDDKPIYRKLVKITLGGASPLTTIHGISGVDKIWLDLGNSFVLNPAGSISYFPVSGFGGDQNEYYVSRTDLTVAYTPSDWKNWVGYITVKYTKTADTSASPVATIPVLTSSCDISSNEYLTGNYRNGKPIYGREIDCGALPNAAAKSIAIPGYNSSYTYWIDNSSSYTYRSSDAQSVTFNYNSGSATIVSSVLGSNISIYASSGMNTFTTTKIVLNYTK